MIIYLFLSYNRNIIMVVGKTHEYRYNISKKTILSQVPKTLSYGKGATNIWKWAN